MQSNTLPYRMIFTINYRPDQEKEAIELWKFLAPHDDFIEETELLDAFNEDGETKFICFISSITDHYVHCYNAVRRGDIISFALQNCEG